MNILFCNTIEPACGVHQFGVNFFNNLYSKEFFYFYDQPTSLEDVRNYIEKENIYVVIVNWHPDIGGWQSGIEKLKGVKKILLYHDWDAQEEKWDAVMFSDPTMQDHGKWFSTPRPIPDANYIRHARVGGFNLVERIPTIGTHGFYGASANLVCERVLESYHEAEMRINVPRATFGDKDGSLLFDTLEKCNDWTDHYPGLKVIPDFRFLERGSLIHALSKNTINCYFRDTAPEWKGVSSALDVAIASGRPLAINKCKGFRHLHNISPSICIEDRSLKEIIETGTEPLKPFIEANTPEKLTEKVDFVMRKVLG